ncbi:MAG: hypothetical protein PWP16_1015 [Eubacteriaceae bacterium]|jgi:chromosome segregation ATPase|nr:hypothetical protein [Eubacteriaceae bacterium]MDK2904014.1 hypothetical protein [Eubacteriaceae bacterium]MDK2936598.1 hypothetical protein [Eubacteriaceae bacterium]MDK2961060.1 hypothetical protein [Eubacteriaceae bacterium]MDN5307652.1 hypothetical protein [Eubacteriaceae bacterium]
MANKEESITLNELRDQSEQTKQRTSRFGSSVFGGYNKKQVNDYTRTLNEQLENAEASFNSRLEEYAAMTEMLKQERDQYGEMYNLLKSEKEELSRRIVLLESDNRGLTLSLSEQKKDPEEFEELVLLRRKLKAYQHYEEEYGDLKTQLGQLKALVNDLNKEVSEYAQNQPDLLERNFEQPVFMQTEREQLIREKNEIAEEKGELIITLERLKDENIMLKAKCQENEEKNKLEVGMLQKTIEQLRAENDLLKAQTEENEKAARRQVKDLRQNMEKYQDAHQRMNEEMVAHLELALEKIRNNQKQESLFDSGNSASESFEMLSLQNFDQDTTRLFDE